MPVDQLFDLYWLGYLLTGDRGRSVQAVIETIEMPEVANQFFKGWMVTWSRKIFIAKVLGYVAPGMGAAELGTRLRRLQSEAWRGVTWKMVPAPGKAELERALLAIDPFPRCALLLRLFEKLPIEDIGILLNADREGVKTATAIGLIELARNLTCNQKSPFSRPVKDSSFGAMEETTAEELTA